VTSHGGSTAVKMVAGTGAPFEEDLNSGRDRADRHEWQFSLRKSVAWTEEEARHSFQGETNVKVEAAHWLELKAKGY